MSRRRKKRSSESGPPIDLNVMPFVDVFSLLTTFLLFTATYVHIGVLEVQVPFFTNKSPASDVDKKAKRMISVNIRLTKENISIETFYDMPPEQRKSHEFDFDDQGINDMHIKLVELRAYHPDNDKVIMFVDDDVVYEDLVKVMDAVKFMNKEEPSIQKDAESNADYDSDQASRYLYRKVVLGSVVF